MYPVSKAFLQAVQENARHYYWTGRITTVAGAVYDFSQEDIVKGSGYISGQCCGSSEIELGTVYAAEMGISLYLPVDRYTLEDTFTNASAYSIADTDVKIISIEFASKEENHVQFFGQVVVDVAAELVGRSASAKGTVIVPIPAGVAGGDAGAGENAGGAGNGSDAQSGDTGAGGLPEGSDSGDNPGGTVEVSVDVELPVSWTEDGKAAGFVTYELNDSEILLHHPVETWHSGKHILSLYYPIEKLVPNITNTFNVYLRMEGGAGTVEAGGCIASISGQAMAAAAAWDGKIEVTEYVPRFSMAGGLQARGFAGEIRTETMELVIREYADHMAGRTALGGFCRPVEIG